MSELKKILTISAFILLIMAVLIGCPMLLKDNTIKNGQYIELNIGSETAAKAITVTEYDVTKLEIEIYDPQGALIDDFSWYPDEGQKSYLIPIAGEGEHEIVVTHISDDNGTVIEAEESAFFDIEAMVITAINIIPGLIGFIDITPVGGELPDPPFSDLVGIWFGPNVMQLDPPFYFDAWVTIGADGSFETSLYNVDGQDLQDMSSMGTFEISGDYFIARPSRIYLDGSWITPLEPMEWATLFTLNGDILILHQDFYQIGEPPYIDWIFYKQ